MQRSELSPPLLALVEKLESIHHLNSTLSLLSWDEQVNLPEGSADIRQGQLATLSALSHEAATSSDLKRLLTEAGKTVTGETSIGCLVREAQKDYERRVRLPASYVDRRTRAQSRAYHAWVEARRHDSFERFAPSLTELLDLAREEASLQGYTPDKAYDYWLDQHDPGMDTTQVTVLFDALRKDLVPLAETILNAPVKAEVSFLRGFAENRQEEFLRTVIARLGFNAKRGRLDCSIHPFCGGNAADIRMTTRFSPDLPLDSLFSSIHETGHALYEQGLPLEWLGTPLAEAAGMAIHESQSRLWENQVGRSRAFWQYWEPLYREAFAEQLEGVSSEALYLAISSVQRCPIRVDADEVTYNLHVILRFELEVALFGGALQVRDLPYAWNERARALLGLDPKNDTEGVLQDIHWSYGEFGYFPSYCLGNMLAAQLWYAALDALPDLEADFARGEYGRLLQWLRDTIHQHGRQLSLANLPERVTGQPLGPQALVRYLKERYLPLYQTTSAV